MKKLSMLAFAIVLGISIGCGGSPVDPSAAAPVASPEQTTNEIEKAAESGAMDPATYGKQ